MKCKHFLGTMLDTAAGGMPQSIEFESHLKTCISCSLKFDGLCRTMDLLDAWKSPEPSAQFNGRLRARLHEAKSHGNTWWWSRLSEPLLAAGIVTLLFAGVVAVRHARHSFIGAPNQQESTIEPVAGSAVEDLQSLEEVDDTAGDSDLLDLIATDQAEPSDRRNAAAH